MTITAIPMQYKGVTFRSTLEASWAHTMDVWGWHWSYEPVALSVNGEAYLPDFHLPHQHVWLEVKGPHDERIEKTHRLSQAIDEDDEDITRPLVVIMRAAGPGDTAIWEGARPHSEIVISLCPVCDYETFVDLAGTWVCRQCWAGQRLQDKPRDWVTNYATSGQKQFHRAPRQQRAA